MPTNDEAWAKPWATSKSSAPAVRCGLDSPTKWHCGGMNTERLEEFLDVEIDEADPIYRCLNPSCRFTNHGAAGTRWEQMVVTYLRSVGPAFANARLWSEDDQWPDEAGIPPDIGGVPGWTIECKNRKAHQYVELAKSMGELEEERAVTRDPFGAVISRRRGLTIEDSYVVMRLGDWARLLGTMATPDHV